MDQCISCFSDNDSLAIFIDDIFAFKLMDILSYTLNKCMVFFLTCVLLNQALFFIVFQGIRLQILVTRIKDEEMIKKNNLTRHWTFNSINNIINYWVMIFYNTMINVKL